MRPTFLAALCCVLATAPVWTQGQPAAPAAARLPIATTKVDGTDNVYIAGIPANRGRISDYS